MKVAETPEAFAERLGLTGVDPRLIAEALTHPSYAAEHGGDDYQRLEFLGDSVLGLVVAQLLYHRFPDRAEGELTRMKNALVCGPVLAELADEIGITGALRLGEGSRRTNVRSRVSVREAAFEALVAVLYIANGQDAAAEFVSSAMGERIDSARLLATTDDAKSRLQEITQSKGLGLPVYHIVEREGPAHAPTFKCAVEVGGASAGAGSGTSKQSAEQAAAADALESGALG